MLHSEIKSCFENALVFEDLRWLNLNEIRRYVGILELPIFELHCSLATP